MLKKKIIVSTVVVAVIVFALWWWDNPQQGDQQSMLLYGNVDIREVELAVNGNERIARMLVQYVDTRRYAGRKG